MDDDEFNEAERTEQEQVFDKAASFVRKAAASLQADDLLYLYARYKQATEGDCTAKKPSVFFPKERQKWLAWNSIASLSRDHAMQQYVDRVRAVNPTFDSDPAAGAQVGTLGKMFSKLATAQLLGDSLPHELRELFDAVQKKDLTTMQRLSDSGQLGRLVNEPDSQGLTLLHWACDSGNKALVQLLLDNQADPAIVDNEDMVPLDCALVCEHWELVRYLFERQPISRLVGPTTRDDLNSYPNDIVKVLQTA